jgi:hypothetical protein
MVFNEMPGPLINDVETGVTNLLKEYYPKTNLNGVVIKARFGYSMSGLTIEIYGLTKRSFREANNDSAYDWFEGYTKEQCAIMKDKTEEFNKEHKLYSNVLSTVEMMQVSEDSVDKTLPPILGNPFDISCQCTDRNFRWFAISNLYETDAFQPIVTALKKHRQFIFENVKNLSEVAGMVSQLAKAAKTIGTSFCKTELTDNGSMLAFTGQIFPVQLLDALRGTKEKVVPINSLPEIKGNLVGFTGYHGGGKTQSSLAILVNIWLVQSGLPPLGKGVWRQNIKKAIGGVFINSDKGHRMSTCQLLLEKMTSLLKDIRKYSAHDVVVILDELGTGTQEDSGIDLGKDVLAALHRRGISTLFTTQIKRVAEFARDELGAACFKLDSQHRIEDGIGDGGMADLRKRTGLDKELR